MAQNSATITVVGNVVRNPVNRTPPGRTPFATMRIASDRRWRDGDGVWQSSDPLYIDVQMSGTLATHCMTSVVRGMPVVVYGRLVTHSWETTRETGEKVTRHSVRIKASHVGVDLNKIVITSAMATRLGQLVPLAISAPSKGQSEIKPDHACDEATTSSPNPFAEHDIDVHNAQRDECALTCEESTPDYGPVPRDAAHNPDFALASA